MSYRHLLIGMLVIALTPRMIHAMATTDAVAEVTRDQISQSVFQRLESDVSSRTENRTRTSTRDKIVLGLRSIQRQQDAVAVTKDIPTFSIEHLLGLCLTVGLPTLLGLFLVAITRYALYLRERERIALRRRPDFKKREKMSLSEFISVVKGKGEPAQLEGDDIQIVEEVVADPQPKEQPVPVWPTEKLDFNQHFNDLLEFTRETVMVSALEIGASPSLSTQQKFDFRKLLEELPTMGSAEFALEIAKPPPPKLSLEFCAPRIEQPIADGKADHETGSNSVEVEKVVAAPISFGWEREFEL